MLTIDYIRSFFVILELGSINKAAERLNVSQSTLTRQIQSLEQEIGSAIFERNNKGVSATAAGQLLRDRIHPLLHEFDDASRQVIAFARGHRSNLRIGYIASSAFTHLNAALTYLREQFPNLRVSLHDLSPGEQITALKEGKIDVAMLGHAGRFLTKDFYTKKIDSSPIYVSLSESNRISKLNTVIISDLQKESFIGALEEDMPGFNTWVTQICKTEGFQPRFVLNADSLAHGLSTVLSENAVMFVPEYVQHQFTPGVVFRRLEQSDFTWDYYVAWQRGKTADAVKIFLSGL